MEGYKAQGPMALLVMILMIGGLDWYLASRVSDVVDHFEAQSAAGHCTPEEPCIFDPVEADVCNAFAGRRLFPTFYSWHLADDLEGEVRAPDGCPRARRGHLIFVADAE